ncbi:MAG: hypothetical protein COU69_04085 [Candidatus Pacebacteria bacterium CG10_big_fil_rev_8_21_14_0_10_56_10]|nr:MAG: hypothetical protein COU69_04085 [Candidatus Pacebacteria bacterium CG10_big_fil_rev_8_21_14_0_10_56_10]
MTASPASPTLSPTLSRAPSPTSSQPNSNLIDPALRRIFRQDRQYLEETELPIVTVSASYKEDLKGFYGLPEDETIPDVVFSRAHYSMPLAIASAAWSRLLEHRQAWIVDPTNYVSAADWRKVKTTELVAKTVARHPVLKFFKDMVDRFGRQQLPILSSITPPLLYLTERIERPILSLHIAAGNILADQGKPVVQVVTDPHVRSEYLRHAGNRQFWYCVFDDQTKTDLLEKATLLHGKNQPGGRLDPERVRVTGPPIDPRLRRYRSSKHPWRGGPLKLCLTTGGLGTNRQEIAEVLAQLLPDLWRRESPFRLTVYAGTHRDLAGLVTDAAHRAGVALSPVTPATDTNPQTKLRLLYHPQIVDANELLMRYGFPWADGFITKPSGDMAYDAAAAGCFLLTLREWGPWEQNIRDRFEQRGISRVAQVRQLRAQLVSLMDAHQKSHSWIERAMLNAHALPPLFLEGAERIIEEYRRLASRY